MYRVVFFGDGTVIYYGQYDVRRKGLILSHVDPEAFQKVVESAKKIDYFHLASAYGYHGTVGCEADIPGEPIVATSITVGGESHGVIHHHRCSGPIPQQLTELEDEIERATQVAQFTN